MSKTFKFTSLMVFLTFIVIVILGIIYLYRDAVAMLNPKGIIALKELNLMMISTLLMLIVVIPVLIMTIVFAWKYRAGQSQSVYQPDYDSSYVAEAVWWGVPLIIVIILSWITWVSTHELDPFKPLESEKKPLTVQVVALNWKWLFIYPEQNIATINYLQIPEKTPIHFELTADAPMNSFWIPQLGGQIYAMPGMRTELFLMADEQGSYRGSSSNISGKGFAGMVFTTQVTTEEEFNSWAQEIAQTPKILDLKQYQTLALPSEYDPKAFFSLKDHQLFNQIFMKNMMPMHLNKEE